MVLDADVLALERLVHGVAEELAQVAGIDGGRIVGNVVGHGVLSRGERNELAAGRRGC
jgi:hypothetical protein